DRRLKKIGVDLRDAQNLQEQVRADGDLPRPLIREPGLLAPPLRADFIRKGGEPVPRVGAADHEVFDDPAGCQMEIVGLGEYEVKVAGHPSPTILRSRFRPTGCSRPSPATRRAWCSTGPSSARAP